MSVGQALPPLKDCRYALDELRNDLKGQAWRVRWFGTLVLLRTVGDVLKKDAELSPEMKLAYCKWSVGLARSKPDQKIYWKFITRDRNAIVHEYEFRAGQSVTVRPGIGHYLRTGQEETMTPGGPTTDTWEIHGGPFDGQWPSPEVRSTTKVSC